MIRNIDALVNLHGTPSLFLSIQEIEEAYQKLCHALPGVQIYYAVKSNNHNAIIEKLNKLGCNFDVCSKKEIDTINALNISADRCIHTHPVKTEETISYAYNKGLRTFVVDNIDELNKMKNYFGKIRILFRLAIRNNNSLADLSKKFGCYTRVELIKLIELANDYGFNDLGICFHSGSQGRNPLIFKKALKSCNLIIKKLESRNIRISTVDIGGGFPIAYSNQSIDIKAYCSKFYCYIKKLLDDGITVIAEPGRFISGNAMVLATKVIGKAKRKNKMWYYIDDSIYNSLSGQIFDHAKYPFYPHKKKNGKKHLSVISGYSCDSFDIINENIKIRLLDNQEVLIYEKMGAYTSVSASEFNGFPKTKIIVID